MVIRGREHSTITHYFVRNLWGARGYHHVRIVWRVKRENKTENGYLVPMLGTNNLGFYPPKVGLARF